jgi:hypothetical protein
MRKKCNRIKENYNQLKVMKYPPSCITNYYFLYYIKFWPKLVKIHSSKWKICWAINGLRKSDFHHFWATMSEYLFP